MTLGATRRQRRRRASAVALTGGLLLAALACSNKNKDNAQAAKRHPRSDGFVDAAWARGRQDDYLRAATATPEPSSALSVLAHFERARRDKSFTFDPSQVRPGDFSHSFKQLDDFQDTSDFDLLYLTNLWYAEGKNLPADVRSAIEQRMLAFKYWYDEPNPPGVIDQKWYWSENHRAIFHTLELLVGQAFPTAKFSNDGRTGAEHAAHAKKMLVDWFDEKARFGFSEWHSDVYYQKDVDPLLTLVEFADDPQISSRAGVMLDLVLVDIAAHLQKGNFGATHGRSYMKDKSIATDQDTFNLSKLLFDDTPLPYQGGADPGATLFARAKKYRLPEVIRRIARDDRPTVDRERMGVPLDALEPVTANPTAPYGFDYDDPKNVPFWWERGAQTVWQAAPMTLATAEKYDLWKTDFFKPFADFRALVKVDKQTVRKLAHDLAPQLGFGLLAEVNSYTWRGRDAMLSTAQDYRPGMRGEQYHAWQATLDGGAVVFTTHPANEPEPGSSWVDGDGYWTGTASMPRSAQSGRASIHLYAPAYPGKPGGILASLGYLSTTHAFFPTERFDDVVRDGHWTFGRKGDGYVALYSWRDVQWRTHDPKQVMTGGLTKPFDLVAPGGADDVWIAEVGEASRWKTFDAFRAAVRSAPLDVKPRPAKADGVPGGFDVRYDSPSEGAMSFGTTGALTVGGKDVALNAYPRMDNRWTTVRFGDRQVHLADGKAKLALDTTSWTRKVKG